MSRSVLAAAASSMLLLAGCTPGSGGDSADTALVFIGSGARQCETSGIPLEQSAQMLANAGIGVLESSCGVRTGVAFAAVCGGPTGEILVHEIRTDNVPDARELGYERVETLDDSQAGTGYMLVRCSERNAAE